MLKIGCEHTYKYLLYYGTVKGGCLIRYDNEKGKGDHKHLGVKERTYEFKSLRRLIEDFRRDVREESSI